MSRESSANTVSTESHKTHNFHTPNEIPHNRILFSEDDEEDHERESENDNMNDVNEHENENENDREN